MYSPYLKKLRLTYTQYIVLLVLWEKDGITVGDICEQLMLDNGTVSPLLKKLQRQGYVEKRRSPEDDRIVNVILTAEGRKLQERAKDIPDQVASCLNLPADKADVLYSLLYELLENNGK